MPNDTLPSSSIGSARRRLAGRLVRGTLWSMLGIAALGLTRLLYTALIGRTGDPGRLADVNTQVSLAFLATFATAAATGAGAAKFLPLTLARSGPDAAAAVRRRLSWWTLAGTAGVVLVLAGASPWLLADAGYAEIGWMCALTAAYAAYSFSKSVLYGFQLPARYAVLEVAADVAILLLTVAAVLWVAADPGGGPGLLLAPLVVGYAGFAVAAALSTPRVRPGPMPALGTELGGFVGYTALGIAAGQGFFQVSMVVAGHVVGAGQAGVYAAAMSLVAPAFFLPRALALAFFPAAAEAVGRGDAAALARHTTMVTRVLVLSMLPAFALAAMLGGPALRLGFGASYAGGGPAFAVLVLAVFLYVVAVPSVNALSAHDLSLARIPPLASTVGVVVGSLTWLVVAHRLGAVGIAVGYLAGMVVQAGIPLLVAHQRLGLSRVDGRQPEAKPAGSGRRSRRLARWGASLCAAVALAGLAVVDERPWVVAACAVGFLATYGLLQFRAIAATTRALRQLRTPDSHR